MKKGYVNYKKFKMEDPTLVKKIMFKLTTKKSFKKFLKLLLKTSKTEREVFSIVNLLTDKDKTIVLIPVEMKTKELKKAIKKLDVEDIKQIKIDFMKNSMPNLEKIELKTITKIIRKFGKNFDADIKIKLF